jgi:dihydroorotate dehydrogenase
MSVDLSTTVAGVPLKNPLICASGEPTMTFAGIQAAIDAGAGAVIAKSTNESEAAKHQLDGAAYALLDGDWEALSWDAPAPRDASLFCRSGLVQLPFDAWLAGLVELDRYARTVDSLVAGSLIVADEDQAMDLAAAMDAAGLRMLELNLSAPHGEEATPGTIRLERAPDRIATLTERVRRAVRVPLLVKLSGQTEDVLDEVAAAFAGGADAVVLTGRQLGFLPDLDTRQPVLGTFGAIGGGWALPLTLRWIAKARARFGPHRTLVATNGVRSGRDIARCLLAGASAAEVCSAVMTGGYQALSSLLDELTVYLDGQGIVRAADIVGEAADAVQTYQAVGGAPHGEAQWRRFAPEALPPE